MDPSVILTGPAYECCFQSGTPLLSHKTNVLTRTPFPSPFVPEYFTLGRHKLPFTKRCSLRGRMSILKNQMETQLEHRRNNLNEK